MTALLIAVPLVPLLAALVIPLRKRLPSGWVSAGATGVSLALLLALFGSSPKVTVTWLGVGPYSLTVGLSLDPLSCLLALLVVGVGFLVGVYAVGYMADEKGKPRFYGTLSFFIGAMLTLVLSNSLVLLFAAWEAVGLASYLLIGFWYTQEGAKEAARKAFLITRLGDLGLLLGWLLLLLTVGTTDIQTVLGAVGEAVPVGVATLAAFLLLLGALGKSAQLPLTAWLPDAMAGPTPVSALIHSATMVAAGVYLLLRLFPLYEAAPSVLTVVLWLGALTALFAALVATVQTDLKRVLAWSTVSQLGEMFFVLGLGGAFAAAFHLTMQALFKSALFLTAGAVGHVAGGYDLRKLGGLWRALPLTAGVFAAAGLTLAGFPPFSAFWSEEAILTRAASVSPFAGAFFLLLIFLAGVYISRAGVATFLSWPGAPKPTGKRPDVGMALPMVLLAVLALSAGWALVGPLESFLPFPQPPEAHTTWTLWAVAASVLGLVFGTWRTLQHGPVPTFSRFPVGLGRGLDVLTSMPVVAVRAIAAGVNGLEHALNALTSVPVKAVWAVSGGVNGLEHSLDTGAEQLATGVLTLARGFNRTEGGFDGGARGLATITLRTATGTEKAEQTGFSGGGNAFARLLGRSGQALRQSESGKLYLYTLILFVWVAAVVVGGVLLWW